MSNCRDATGSAPWLKRQEGRLFFKAVDFCPTLSSVSVILQLICPDRPALVSELAGWVAANGGNIHHADHHTDAGAGLFLSRIEWGLEGFGLPREAIGSGQAPC